MKRICFLLLFVVSLLGTQAVADTIYLFSNPQYYSTSGSPAGGSFWQDDQNITPNYYEAVVGGVTGQGGYFRITTYVWSSGVTTHLFGGLSNLTFNQKTDILSGSFTPTYAYGVPAYSGWFTDNWKTGRIAFGTGTPPLATPEPSTLILLGTGLLGIAFASRRRVGVNTVRGA